MIFYSVDEDFEVFFVFFFFSLGFFKICWLEGVLGVFEEYFIVLYMISLCMSDDGFVVVFREVFKVFYLFLL